ncbi:hypothetical protein SRHO_G00020090 [Serrasalmus rhombeus]
MKRNLLIILIITSGVFGADRIGPDDQDVSGKEGEHVKLKCSYETSGEYVLLYWYRQYPNRAVQYLLRKAARKQGYGSDTTEHRFESITSWSSTDLTVRELRLSDTALYYCALRVGAQ